jgi:FkbM family methyltransferase
MQEDQKIQNNQHGTKCCLPNGLHIYELNPYETKFLYKEIFKEEVYLRHGISIDSDATIIDVGANIGLFSLFFKTKYPDARIYAFEPAPELFKILQQNVAPYQESVVISDEGISSKDGSAIFAYYPKYSILSGFHTSSSEDLRSLQLGAYNQLSGIDGSKRNIMKEIIDASIEDKLKEKKEFECHLTSISNVIRRSDIKRVDLLKIDAEKSEEDILNGIFDCDWPKIKQLVMEVHDSEGGVLKRIKALLESKGLEFVVEQEGQFEGGGIFNIYAKRNARFQCCH